MDSLEQQMPCAAFADSLKSSRETLNARFVERQRAGCKIDAADFLEHLQADVGPIVCHVADHFPECACTATEQLFDVSLNLFEASLLGPATRAPGVETVWRRLLPAAARLLARDSGRIAGRLSNAALNIWSQSGTRPDWWVAQMTDVAASCESADHLFECGKLLAWQAGMAQYRAAALATARTLPAKLAACVLGLPAETSPAEVVAVVDRLATNPWLSVAAAAAGSQGATTVQCVRQIGAFRGFNGLFLRPPTVRFADGSFWVGDGELLWQFVADEYGSHFHRIGPGPVPDNQSNSRVGLRRDGTVVWQAESKAFTGLASASSFACDGTTLAVTIPTSHHIYLLAHR